MGLFFGHGSIHNLIIQVCDRIFRDGQFSGLMRVTDRVGLHRLASVVNVRTNIYGLYVPSKFFFSTPRQSTTAGWFQTLYFVIRTSYFALFFVLGHTGDTGKSTNYERQSTNESFTRHLQVW
jgi:hypothetical protein